MQPYDRVRRTFLCAKSALEAVFFLDNICTALPDRFLRTHPGANSTACTFITDPEAIALNLFSSIGKALPGDGIIQEIKPFPMSLIDVERIQNVPALTRIYLVHTGIFLKYAVYPFFSHDPAFSQELKRLAVRAHGGQRHLSPLCQLFIKRLSLGSNDVHSVIRGNHDIDDPGLGMPSFVYRGGRCYLYFSEHIHIFFCLSVHYPHFLPVPFSFIINRMT